MRDCKVIVLGTEYAIRKDNFNSPELKDKNCAGYEKVVEALEAITFSNNTDADEMFKASDEVKKQMDYLLNYNVSNEIFAKCNPFTLTDSGDFYVEKVFEEIGGLIEEKMNKRLEKKKAKIRKATAAYRK